VELDRCLPSTSVSLASIPLIMQIRGFLGGDYEECRLLGCYAVLLL
jgi:hypothetical protein